MYSNPKHRLTAEQLRDLQKLLIERTVAVRGYGCLTVSDDICHYVPALLAEVYEARRALTAIELRAAEASGPEILSE